MPDHSGELVERLLARCTWTDDDNQVHDDPVWAPLLREAAAALSRAEEARGYLVRNVLTPNGAEPLPTLIGVCTQVDHITATLGISSAAKGKD